MTLPINGGVVTTPFDEPRPMFDSVGAIIPPEKRASIHGALDVAGGDGWLRALEDGAVQAWVITRDSSERWSEWMYPFHKEKEEIQQSPYGYFYDTYGGLITLSTRTHVHLFTHFWSRELQERFHDWATVESRKDTRFPSFVSFSAPQTVRKGDKLAQIGNAGHSTGPHIHWEVHHRDALWDGDFQRDGRLRIDPTPFIKE